MKKFFSLVLALVMALSLTTIAWGAATIYVDGTNGNDTTGTGAVDAPFATLAKAVESTAETDVTINVAAGNYTLPVISNKNVTFVGGRTAIFDISAQANTWHTQFPGTSLAFEGVTVKSGNVNYRGLNVQKLSYTDCAIVGLQFLYASEVTFTDCELDSNGAEHSVWTYGADEVTFTNCTFTYADRAVNVYSDQAADSSDVSFDDCEFTKEDGEDTTGAIEINSSLMTDADVSVNDCEINDGDLWWVSSWDSAYGADTSVTIDGDPYAAAVVDGKNYVTLQAAVNAAQDGDTIVLMDDNDEVVTIDKVVSFDANGFSNNVTMTPPTGNEVLKTTTGAEVVVPAVTRGDKFDLYAADAGMKVALAAGAEDVAGLSFTEVAAKPNSDGSGNLAYIAANNGEYFVKTTNPTVADYAVTVAGKTDVLYYVSVVNVADVQYGATAKAFTNFGTKCGQLYRVDTTKEYYVIEKAEAGFALAKDDVSYVVNPAARASYVNVLVGNEIKTLAAIPVDDNNTVLTIDEILGHNWAVTGVKATTTGKTVPTQVTCLNCSAVVTKFYDAAGKVPAGTVATPVPGYEQATNTHDAWFFVAPVAGTYTGTVVTPSTDKVQSAETFDAGIAMYVGMSVMAAAGSAVVIGKKKD